MSSRWVREDALPRPIWWSKEPLFYFAPYFTLWAELSYRTIYWIILKLFVHLPASSTSFSTARREWMGFILLTAPGPSIIWFRMEAQFGLAFRQPQVFNPNARYEFDSLIILWRKIQGANFRNLVKCKRLSLLLPFICVASSNLLPSGSCKIEMNIMVSMSFRGAYGLLVWCTSRNVHKNIVFLHENLFSLYFLYLF